jgi:hypothetical protein
VADAHRKQEDLRQKPQVLYETCPRRRQLIKRHHHTPCFERVDLDGIQLPARSSQRVARPHNGHNQRGIAGNENLERNLFGQVYSSKLLNNKFAFLNLLLYQVPFSSFLCNP